MFAGLLKNIQICCKECDQQNNNEDKWNNINSK